MRISGANAPGELRSSGKSECGRRTVNSNKIWNQNVNLPVPDFSDSFLFMNIIPHAVQAKKKGRQIMQQG